MLYSRSRLGRTNLLLCVCVPTIVARLWLFSRQLKPDIYVLAVQYEPRVRPNTATPRHVEVPTRIKPYSAQYVICWGQSPDVACFEVAWILPHDHAICQPENEVADTQRSP